MKLDGFLKVEKVRCVDGHGRHLTVGETYHVLGLSVPNNLIQVENDNGFITEYDFEKFEPVLDQSENPEQGVELTPEFEAVEPTFKVGDKVYKYGETDVKTVLEVFEDGYMRISNYPHRVNHEVLCYATPENHAMLSKPYPHIKFEAPTKP